MNWLYICPYCNERLNPNQTLILLAEYESRRMLVGFHPEPGNYEIYFPSDANLQDGQVWKFFCPVCRADLRTAEENRLCAVIMLEPTVSRRVVFSRVAGERDTSILYDQELEHRYSKADVEQEHVRVPIRRDGDDKHPEPEETKDIEPEKEPLE